MIIGYARVSTDDQNLDAQTDALEAAGAEHVHLDPFDGRALRDRHLGLGDGPVARQVDRDAAQEVQDAHAALEAGLGDGDERAGGPFTVF